MLATVKPLALGLLLCSPALATSGFFGSPNPQLGSNALIPRKTSNVTITQCGRDALPGNENCPLNVCCSEFGNCGTTADFCGTGCQNGCDDIQRPSCEESTTSSKRTVGYYESWANDPNTRKCQNVSPEELNVTGFTHINFAFLLFDPNTFAIAPADNNDTELIARFTDLKTANPGLQTWVAIGGWNFNEPGPTATAFSDMVGCAENRTKFINEITHFMEAYAFDGLDLDWEYPSASDRGGRPADRNNFVLLTQDLRAAFGEKFGLSVTLPASYYYMQNFDVSGMASHVDFFNIMTYDLHGVWDKGLASVGIRPHTNLTEIDAGLDLLWRADVAPEKVNMGMAWYGRSYTLQDTNCTTPNGVCQFNAAGMAGPCSNATGTLNLQEIQDILAEEQITPVLDKVAGVKYMAYKDSTQWVSYDDDETIRMKQEFAGSRCLGGTMVWAMDQANQKSAVGLPPAIRSPTSDSTSPPSYDNGTPSTCPDQVTVTPNTTTCASLIAASPSGNFTAAQLSFWNPTLFKSCSDLKPGTKLCTSPPGGWYTLAPPPPPPFAAPAANSTSAAEPALKTQPGIAPDCKTFATAKAGDTCVALAAANGIEPRQLYDLNPVLGVDGADCAQKLWAGESYCVGTDAAAAAAGTGASVGKNGTSSSLAAKKRSVHLGGHKHGHVRH
jgi:GH18 family chitinase